MYDDFSDRLMISRKNSDDVVAGSINFLNLTLDFSTTNKIINIEIKNVSSYLESLDIDSAILNNLTNAEIVFKNLRDGYIIYFILSSGNLKERIPFNFQLKSAPILS